jgi:hypothetical protein
VKEKESSPGVRSILVLGAVVIIITMLIIATLGRPLVGGDTITYSPVSITPGEQVTATLGVPSTLIIATLGEPMFGESSITRTPVTITPGEPVSATPVAPSTQTISYIITLKAIDFATYCATTRTPTPIRPVPPTGIYEDARIKFSGEKLFLATENLWQGFVGGYSVSIYVGALLDDPTQGAIVVYLRLPYRSYFERILTPEKHGSVRVVAETNNRLTLVAADGAIFYFDVPARRFVDTLTETVLTATPPATGVHVDYCLITPLATPYP